MAQSNKTRSTAMTKSNPQNFNPDAIYYRMNRYFIPKMTTYLKACDSPIMNQVFKKIDIDSFIKYLDQLQFVFSPDVFNEPFRILMDAMVEIVVTATSSSLAEPAPKDRWKFGKLYFSDAVLRNYMYHIILKDENLNESDSGMLDDDYELACFIPSLYSHDGLAKTAQRLTERLMEFIRDIPTFNAVNDLTPKDHKTMLVMLFRSALNGVNVTDNVGLLDLLHRIPDIETMSPEDYSEFKNQVAFGLKIGVMSYYSMVTTQSGLNSRVDTMFMNHLFMGYCEDANGIKKFRHTANVTVVEKFVRLSALEDAFVITIQTEITPADTPAGQSIEKQTYSLDFSITFDMLARMIQENMSASDISELGKLLDDNYKELCNHILCVYI